MKTSLIVLCACCAVSSAAFAYQSAPQSGQSAHSSGLFVMRDDPGVNPPKAAVMDDPGVNPPKAAVMDDPGVNPPKAAVMDDPGVNPPKDAVMDDPGVNPPKASMMAASVSSHRY
jgi:hypothetical protein